MNTNLLEGTYHKGCKHTLKKALVSSIHIECNCNPKYQITHQIIQNDTEHGVKRKTGILSFESQEPLDMLTLTTKLL